MRSCRYGTIEYPSWEERRTKLLLQNDGADVNRDDALKYINEIIQIQRRDDEYLFDYSKLREFAREWCDDDEILLMVQSIVFDQMDEDGLWLCVAQDASERLQNDEAFMGKILDNPFRETLRHCSDRLRDDENFIMPLIKKNANYLEYVSPRLRKDPRIVMVAAKANDSSLRFAHSEILANKEFMFQIAIELPYGNVVRYASEDLLDDQEFMFQIAVESQHRHSVQYASEALLDDQEFVIRMMKENGSEVNYLEFISLRLQGDPKTVLAAIKENVHWFSFASKDIRENKGFIMDAVEVDSACLQFTTDEIRDDEEVIMHSIRNSPPRDRTLLFASTRLQGNKPLVLEAVQKVGRDMQFVSPELRNDFDVVQTAVRGGFGCNLSSRREDEYSRFSCVEQVVSFASESLQKNIDILASSELRALLLPQTDILLDQHRTPSSLFADLLERAKDNPITLYYLLKNRLDLIPGNMNSIPVSCNEKKRKRNS